MRFQVFLFPLSLFPNCVLAPNFLSTILPVTLEVDLVVVEQMLEGAELNLTALLYQTTLDPMQTGVFWIPVCIVCALKCNAKNG